MVAEAGTADDAIRYVGAHKPTVLVLDLNMPGKTGLEVLPIVRKEAPSVKVLVLTGRDEDAYIMRYQLEASDTPMIAGKINRISSYYDADAA